MTICKHMNYVWEGCKSCEWERGEEEARAELEADQRLTPSTDDLKAVWEKAHSEWQEPEWETERAERRGRRACSTAGYEVGYREGEDSCLVDCEHALEKALGLDDDGLEWKELLEKVRALVARTKELEEQVEEHYHAGIERGLARDE